MACTRSPRSGVFEFRDLTGGCSVMVAVLSAEPIRVANSNTTADIDLTHGLQRLATRENVSVRRSTSEHGGR
jgi:hypothetical protein